MSNFQQKQYCQKQLINHQQPQRQIRRQQQLQYQQQPQGQQQLQDVVYKVTTVTATTSPTIPT